jgi:hypothetical protein
MSCAIRTQVVHTLRRAKTLRAPRYRGQRQFWADMPRGASSTKWFEELFGFREGGSYRENRAHFRMEGEVLCVDGAPKYKTHFVGRWSTPSLAELRAELPTMEGGLHFKHLPTPTGVEPLILDPQNAGAVFQAASQFNALEMVGPGVSPRQGIACYSNDPTQGPKCALACPGGTVFRNYLVNEVGQGDKQIDLLADVGKVLENRYECYWTMQNGYAMPKNMRGLAHKLEASPRLIEDAEAALRVGVHWNTQARPPHTHRVCQVYASALPVAYGHAARSAEWEPFARLVLRAAYEATLAVGALKAREAGRRQAVYLTSLGGGAFGNRDAWITEAVRGALDKFKDAPLDVYKVHYGTRVQTAWRDVGSEYPEPEGRGARRDPPSGRAGRSGGGGSEQLCRPS